MPPPTEAPRARSVAEGTRARSAPPPVDACEPGAPPPDRRYFGILRQARCRQDLMRTMGGVATFLGVECEHCHAPSTEPGERFDYAAPTESKRVASFMQHAFVDGLRHLDGGEVRCDDCHVDRDGRPVAKILGEPRDRRFAMEWMTTVLVRKFVTERGERLRCATCHLEAPGREGFRAEVILKEDLPAFPLPRDLLRSEPRAAPIENPVPRDGEPDEPPGEGDDRANEPVPL